GWALFGIPITAALIANLALAVLLWRRGERFWLDAVAWLMVVAALDVFFVWVYPTNVATRNWTEIPTNWRELRARWEFGHLAGACLIFIALCSTAFARKS